MITIQALLQVENGVKFVTNYIPLGSWGVTIIQMILKKFTVVTASILLTKDLFQGNRNR